MKAVKEEIQNLEATTFCKHTKKTCNIRESFNIFHVISKIGRIPPNHVQSCFFFKSFPALRPKNSALGKNNLPLPQINPRASDAATKGSGADALGFWWCQQTRKDGFLQDEAA